MSFKSFCAAVKKFFKKSGKGSKTPVAAASPVAVEVEFAVAAVEAPAPVVLPIAVPVLTPKGCYGCEFLRMSSVIHSIEAPSRAERRFRLEIQRLSALLAAVELQQQQQVVATSRPYTLSVSVRAMANRFMAQQVMVSPSSRPVQAPPRTSVLVQVQRFETLQKRRLSRHTSAAGLFRRPVFILGYSTRPLPRIKRAAAISARR